MPERDDVTWTTTVSAYRQVLDMDSASSLANQMPERNVATWNCLIDGYMRLGNLDLGVLEIGKEVHMYMVQNGFVLDVYIGSAMVYMYSKCGKLERALLVFFNLPKRNLFCWNAIIKGLAAHGYAQEALKMFVKMETELLKPNAVTFVSVLTACTHAGLVEEGRRIYRRMIDDCSLLGKRNGQVNHTIECKTKATH